MFLVAFSVIIAAFFANGDLHGKSRGEFGHLLLWLGRSSITFRSLFICGFCFDVPPLAFTPIDSLLMAELFLEQVFPMPEKFLETSILPFRILTIGSVVTAIIVKCVEVVRSIFHPLRSRRTPCSSQCYNEIAEFAVQLENWQYEADEYDSHIIKRFTFGSLDYFSGMIYIAFFKVNLPKTLLRRSRMLFNGLNVELTSFETSVEEHFSPLISLLPTLNPSSNISSFVLQLCSHSVF